MILSIPVLFIFLKSNKLDIQIGELSYPVYISHMLIAMVFGGLGITFLKSGFVVALGTIFFSFLINRFVALPIEKYRQSRLSM
jgi:peptidoglycan/LPS O-acetylase OafA/YrhL